MYNENCLCLIMLQQWAIASKFSAEIIFMTYLKNTAQDDLLAKEIAGNLSWKKHYAIFYNFHTVH